MDKRQDDMMDELAERIAQKNDERARQRYDELRNPQKYWTPQQKRGNSVVIWVCIVLIVLVIWSALSIGR